MRVVTGRRFTIEKHRVQRDYALKASEQVAYRFRDEVDEAINSITMAPNAIGHLIPRKFHAGIPHRRKNLKNFPFFIIYTYHSEVLTLLWLLPSRSNPAHWFKPPSES